MPSYLPTRPAAITVTVLLWGSAFISLPALGYADLASGRLLLAALAFAALSRRVPLPRPARAQLPLLAALGATGYAAYHLLLSAIASGGGARVQRDGAWAWEASSQTVVVAVLARPGRVIMALAHSRWTTPPPTSLVLA